MSRFCNIIFYREDRTIMPALVSRIMASKEIYALIPRTCEHVRLVAWQKVMKIADRIKGVGQLTIK